VKLRYSTGGDGTKHSTPSPLSESAAAGCGWWRSNGRRSLRRVQTIPLRLTNRITKASRVTRPGTLEDHALAQFFEAQPDYGRTWRNDPNECQRVVAVVPLKLMHDWQPKQSETYTRQIEGRNMNVSSPFGETLTCLLGDSGALAMKNTDCSSMN
jgi:hypothetical protein